MLEGLNPSINWLFIFTTFLSVWLFLRSIPIVWRSKNDGLELRLGILSICSVWLTLQAWLGAKQFYLAVEAFPPRMVFLVAPPLITCILLLIFWKKNFLSKINIEKLQWVHIVRIPVEFTLWKLYQEKYIPEMMTFEGQNYDIIAGITAPMIWYFCFYTSILPRKIALLWNLVCLALLLNVVLTGLFSTPSTIQLFNIDSPNIAVLFFPFVWLPCMVVPIVLFAHLLTIIRLSQDKEEEAASDETEEDEKPSLIKILPKSKIQIKERK